MKYNGIESELLVNNGDADEKVELIAPTTAKQWIQRGGIMAVLFATLALVGLALREGHGGGELATGHPLQNRDLATPMDQGQVESNQPNWQIVKKESDLCSTTKEDCMSTKCCKSSGFHCLKTGLNTAKCAKYCTKGKTCTVVSDQVTFNVKEQNTMFCFAVYTKNTGSSKVSHEKELLTRQYAQRVSLFACDAHAVYSDVEVSLGDGLVTQKLVDVEGDFYFAKRKITGSWVNTGMFTQAWKAIGRAGQYLNYDWTVKVDADAVFFPQKLLNRIHLLPVPLSGVFLQNCQTVDYGFFGNLEVFSKTAFMILVSNVDTCKHTTVSDWKIGVHHGKYGPMGEDLFAEICLRKNGVSEVEAFDITTDGACEAKRPGNEKKDKKWKPDCTQTHTPGMHPFKKPDEYFACMAAAAPLA